MTINLFDLLNIICKLFIICNFKLLYLVMQYGFRFSLTDCLIFIKWLIRIIYQLRLNDVLSSNVTHELILSESSLLKLVVIQKQFDLQGNKKNSGTFLQNIFWSSMLFNFVLYFAFFNYLSVTVESFVDETRTWRIY